jgi:hypothetical protein
MNKEEVMEEERQKQTVHMTAGNWGEYSVTD